MTTDPRAIIAEAREILADCTPAPLHVCQSPPTVGQVEDAHGIPVATCWGGIDPSEEVRDRRVAANAQLFARSPELIAALADALEQALARETTSEQALRQRLNELATLRSRVGDLRADCSRHERRARVEAARSEFWKATALLHMDRSERDHDRHIADRKTALAILKEYGEEP
jgi:hypothetical protein